MFPMDVNLLELINQHHAPWLDGFMWFMSDKLVWIPLYLVIIGALFYHFGKKAWIQLVIIALLITCTDRFTSGFMKPFFEQERPCQRADLQVRAPEGCGSIYGFASSHAANTMGLAVYMILLFRNRLTLFMIPWSLLIGYSRMYLGKHFPSDVLIGWLVGLTLAWLLYLIYRKLSRSNKSFL